MIKQMIFFAIFCVSLHSKGLELSSIDTEFVQVITSQENEKIKYSGNFYANENKALWIYKKPIQKQIYLNLDKIVIIEPKLEQATITSLKNVPDITEILQNAQKSSEDEYIAKFDELTYIIKTKNSIPTNISYKDKLDNNISLNLINTKVNLVLDDTLFKPIIPKEYDIITH